MVNVQLHFGGISEEYHRGRKPYPSAVMDYIFSQIGKCQNVLDVACGTGIGTRQLAERIPRVYGCDADERMLNVAKRESRESHSSIEYTLAPAHNLPYDAEMFDAVTVFGAFHWFCNRESAEEMKRVLKEGGTFFATSRNRTKAEIPSQYEDIIERAMGITLPENVKIHTVSAEYHPVEVLKETGFADVQKNMFMVHERFTIDEYVARIKTTRAWGTLVINDKERATDTLKKSLIPYSSSSGYIESDMPYYVVSGRKR